MIPEMGILSWAGSNWFDLFQTVVIVGTLYLDIRTRRTATRIEITKQHREIWTEQARRPELSGIREATVDLVKDPITAEEELFVGFLVHHLSASYYATKAGVLSAPDALPKDIQRFFSRPIAKSVWEKMRPMQDTEFIRFVEGPQTV